MTSLWPWLAVAGLGALHGLNPATGWMFAAAWGVHSRDRAQALRALMPIAVGHTASIALVAAAVVLGLSGDQQHRFHQHHESLGWDPQHDGLRGPRARHE
jgi:hypothetical protein